MADKVSDYLAKIGSKGGKAGRGTKKKRSAAFYAELSKKGVEARNRKRKQK